MLARWPTIIVEVEIIARLMHVVTMGLGEIQRQQWPEEGLKRQTHGRRYVLVVSLSRLTFNA